MKNLFIYIALLVPFFMFAQELDEAYLESLPEGVKEDVLEKAKLRDELEKPVYRRASTMIDKEIDEDEDEDEDRTLRFGEKIFDQMQTSFMPVNEPNLDSSYVLDFGDVLEVQMIGQKDSISELPLKRDGSINIPEIGKVNLGGLSLGSAISLIKNKVKNSLIGTEVFVTLVNVRDIQVLISGNAFNPGLYTLNGNSNVLHALSMAGGIDENGSYRSVNIVRDNKNIFTMDLYDIFIFGKSDYGPRLRSGDSIFVKPYQNVVNISSGVKRPGLYELIEGENFSDLINFANGYTSSADKDYMAVESLNKESISFKRIDSTLLDEIEVKDGDSLIIREYKYRKVSIEGAVVLPGEYTITEGESLSSIIKRAGGYKDFAYPFGGFLDNKRTKEINEIAKEKLYSKFIENILLKTDLASNEAFPLILEELRNTPVSGRIMAEFDVDLISQNPSLDTTLEDGDKILIPYITQQVYVYGEVNNTGTIRYKAGRDLSYYLKNVGGIKESADTDNIFVVFPNGKTFQNNQTGRLAFFENLSEDTNIYPGSIIYVPKKSNLAEPVQVAAIWAPIISSLALSLTSLSVLNNNP